ncbi:hypothetical protein HDU96_003049, partial [Phlyctochytrium bullatum]
LAAERSLLLRLHYKNKNQHTAAPHFRKLVQVKRLLQRLDDMRMDEAVDRVLAEMTGTDAHGTNKKQIKRASAGGAAAAVACMPSVSRTSFLLAKMLGAFAVVTKSPFLFNPSPSFTNPTPHTAPLPLLASHFRAVASQTYFLPLALTSMAAYARLWVLAGSMLPSLEETYRKLRWSLASIRATEGTVAAVGGTSSSDALPERIEVVVVEAWEDNDLDGDRMDLDHLAAADSATFGVDLSTPLAELRAAPADDSDDASDAASPPAAARELDPRLLAPPPGVDDLWGAVDPDEPRRKSKRGAFPPPPPPPVDAGPVTAPDAIPDATGSAAPPSKKARPEPGARGKKPSAKKTLDMDFDALFERAEKAGVAKATRGRKRKEAEKEGAEGSAKTDAPAKTTLDLDALFERAEKTGGAKSKGSGGVKRKDADRDDTATGVKRAKAGVDLDALFAGVEKAGGTGRKIGKAEEEEVEAAAAARKSSVVGGKKAQRRKQ